MVTSGDLPGLDLPNLDSHSELGALGAVELAHPTQDIDGDGLPDTVTTNSDHAMHVWTDMDHDGYADHVTVVDTGGDYSAWEFHHHPDGSSEWVRTDEGRLGK
ncbi:DUF6802 family protein [Nocardia sp. NBC_01327]|uniref:DUF6802 family protein n=1 Tax=Nocardia sp. NBC_01327 TaxID=2903593 RepID=UPI002E0E007A|nr:hypothetical protein OG326_07135 [Nocardia sp. NBC_01327]